MSENFARVETKYLISVFQAETIGNALEARGFVRPDFGSPKVQSLYYDTPDLEVIRASLERPVYKEKLRLRAYGEPGGLKQSFVEIKKKYNGVVYKRRTLMPLQEAMEGLRRGCLPASAGQVGREAAWLANSRGLVPSAVIAYNRDAWFHPEDPGVRVTVDRDLSFRDWSLNLNVPGGNLPILPDDVRLLEIKTGGALPVWLARLLQDCGARRAHFSKYGQAYRMYLAGRKAPERSEVSCSTVSLARGA